MVKILKNMKFGVKIVHSVVLLFLFAIAPNWARAEVASVYLKPAGGSFTVGSTLEMGVYLNTGGNVINAIKADLMFPPDKLQIISPTVGKSLVSFWVVQPSYSNTDGLVTLQGGVPPPGINTSDGLITTLVFRVVGVGSATVSVTNTSKVLLADGKGTNILGQRSDAILNLKLPPADGPRVVAPRHPDSTKWYSDDNVDFIWQLPLGATAVSYVLNSEPVTVPDDISEGNRTSITYQNLSSGIYYFHLKSFNSDSGWGGVSHFGVNIDSDSPANFALDVSPRANTSTRRPTLIFSTTDKDSGISHYLLKIVSLTPDENQDRGDPTPFFIEVTSPFVLSTLDFGKYDVIVRAYDFAGNFTEAQTKLNISQTIFRSAGTEGINIASNIILPWWLVYALLGALVILALYLAHFSYRRHREVEHKLAMGVLNMVETRITRAMQFLRQKKEELGKSKINNDGH